MPANTSFTAGQVLTAQQMTNLPWGVVQTTAGGTSSRGIASLTTGTTNLAATGIVDVTGASMTFTGVAGRLYKVTITGAAASTSSAGLCQFIVADGSNNVLMRQREEFSANGYGTVTVSLIFTLTGSGTIKLRMDSEVATTTVFGAVPDQGTMVIEDIGPST
jgi:hypothetical protein